MFKPDRLKFKIWMQAPDAPKEAQFKEEMVYADECQITANGGVAFVTYVEDTTQPMPENGQPLYTPMHSLIVPNGRWSHVENVTQGEALWRQPSPERPVAAPAEASDVVQDSAGASEGVQ